MSKKQTYKCIEENSILHGIIDNYQLTQEEVYKLYSFFLVNSLCKDASRRKKTLTYYGWPCNDIRKSGLKSKLSEIIDLNHFSFVGQKELKDSFLEKKLGDGEITCFCERGVISGTRESNNFYKLFYRIRNCLAHGNFSLLEVENTKMVLMQDNQGSTITARMVFKLESLLKIVATIDKNKVI